MSYLPKMSYLHHKLNELLTEAEFLIETEFSSYEAETALESLKDIRKKLCGEEEE